jgi:hypothetical protein
MSLVGMGQVDPTLGASVTGVATPCGADPCGFFDYIWLSNACQAYLGCADPTNALYVGATQGALAVVGNAAGSAVGTVATSTASGIASGLASSTNIPVSVWYLGAAVAAFFLIESMVKK